MSLLRLVAFSAFCLLAGSVGKGDFQIQIDFAGTGEGIVEVKDGGSTVFTTSNQSLVKIVSLPVSGSYTVVGNATPLTVSASTSYVGTGNMSITTQAFRASVFSEPLEVTVTPSNPNAGSFFGSTYTVDSPNNGDLYKIKYTFNALANSNFTTYSYSFGGNSYNELGNAVTFNALDVGAANPTIDYSVFSGLGPGTYKGFVRLVDLNGRDSIDDFDFTILPSGGSAVPEPSSLLLAGLAAAGLAGSRFRKRRAVKN